MRAQGRQCGESVHEPLVCPAGRRLQMAASQQPCQQTLKLPEGPSCEAAAGALALPPSLAACCPACPPSNAPHSRPELQAMSRGNCSRMMWLCVRRGEMMRQMFPRLEVPGELVSSMSRGFGWQLVDCVSTADKVWCTSAILLPFNECLAQLKWQTEVLGQHDCCGDADSAWTNSALVDSRELQPHRQPHACTDS